MPERPADFYELVCQALAPRCAGGAPTVADLGRPFDGGTLERWMAAGLLSTQEVERLRPVLFGEAPDVGAIRAALGTAPEGLPAASAEWGWGFSAEVEPTLPDIALPPPPEPSEEASVSLPWRSTSWTWGGSSEGSISIESLPSGPANALVERGSGRFRVGERLQRSRFYDVHAARDLLLGRDLVVHVRRADGPISRVAFIEAVRLQASLQHPNVQPVYELSQTPDGEPFYATSVALDDTLGRVLKAVAQDEPGARARFGTMHLLEILLDAARAIAFAHRQGVVHRDVRPAEIRVGPFGEVQLAGWFRARKRADGADGSRDALLNMVAGGLGYLAPERLSGGLFRCGPAADVWGLGAVLYAVLTWQPPLAGKSSTELIAELGQGELPPPRARARRGVEVPPALEALCMQALAIDPERRRLSAEEFAAEIEDFLDGTRAEERRLEQAEELHDDARLATERYAEARTRLHGAWERAASLRAPAGRADLARAREARVEADQRRAEAEAAFFQADDAFARVLAALPGYEPARYGLCALYLRALQDVERGRMRVPADYLRASIDQLDPGGFAEVIEALTHLELRTSPGGLEVTFHQYRDEHGVRVLDEGRKVGSTPLAMAHLRPGDYLLVLRDYQGQETRLSVHLARGERVSLHLQLPDERPEGFVFVPPGPFACGADGDEGVLADALPRGRCALRGYFIGRHPVTFGEYRLFLDDLLRDGAEAAAARAPRAFDGAPPLWSPAGGGFPLPFEAAGVTFDADQPVVGVSADDALAYIAWRARRDGRRYRLPTEMEWEKAARGAEGRAYPWGERPETSYCAHLSSGLQPHLPAVGAVETDVSVYGMTDVAGTVRELTDSFAGEHRVLRGGSWRLPFSECHLAVRAPLTPATPLLSLGFRLALDAEDGAVAAPPAIEPEREWPVPDAPRPFSPSEVSAAGFLSEELTIEGRSVLLRLQDRPPPPARRKERKVDVLDGGPERYVVLEEIARGSMGRVVLAYDDVLERHVALKILHDKHKDDKLARYRFAMEARITGRMQHPTMVPIYDMGRLPGGQHFFAMKPVEGMSLQDVLRGRSGGDRRSLADYGRDRLVTVLRRVCQGVAFAHEHHVVHRDLKPANILIGEFGEVAIVDLGLARQLRPDASDRVDVREASELAQEDGRITRVGSVIGTPYYMSPEQAMGLGELVGPHSDVYGLGAILYHVLTGRPPFAGKKVNEVLAKVRRGNPKPPSAVAPDQEIPAELDAIVMRTLSMDPEERPQSALVLARALAEWQESARLQEKEREIVDQRAARAARAFEAHEEELGRLEQLRGRLLALRDEVRHADPVERRRLFWHARRQIQAQEERVEARIAEAIRQSRAAIDARHPEVRARLAALLQQRYLRAEEALDGAAQAYYGRLLRKIDEDGSLARWLAHGAPVTLRTMPAQLTAAIYRDREHERMLRPDELVERGATPLAVPDLPVGSALATVTASGTTLRVPFLVRRDHPVHLELPWPASLRPGFVVVSGGRFLYGGDPVADEGQPPRAARLPTFQIAVHPVTCLEYHEWLEELRVGDPEQHALRTPRLGRHGPPLWGPIGQRLLGGFAPHRPVTGIALADAHAYAQWRSARDGVSYRLPTSAEWEKAARGVDGRAWPWGHHPEPALVRSERHELHDVGAFPEDVSPYGVQDLVTGVVEWTLTAAREDSSACYIRGGCGALPTHGSPCAARLAWDPREPSPFLGFRLVAA